MVEKDKVGGTCLQRGLHPGQGAARDGRGVPHGVEAAEFGINTADADARLLASPRPASRRSSTSWSTAWPALLKSRKVTIYDGTGTLGAGHVVTVTGGESGDVELLGDGRGPGLRLGAPHDPRLRGRRQLVRHLRRAALARAAAAHRGGHRRRRHRLRVRLDDGRPRHQGDRSSRRCPRSSPAATRTSPSWSLRSFKKRGIDVRTGVAVTGHSPDDDGGTTVQLRRGRDARRRRWWCVSVGRRPVHRGRLGLDGTGGRGRRARLRRGRRVLPHRPSPACARSATSSPRRRWPTSASPRASSSSRTSSARTRSPVDYGRVPWCIYCQPEVAFAGHSEQAAKEAGFDVVVSKHRYIGNGRALIIGETDGMVKIIAEKRADGTGGPDPRRPHGRPVGHRAARPGLPGRQLGGHASTRSPSSSSPTRRCSELFGESVLALTGRSLHG